jgi:catechol 2,3-dioxygenase
MKVDQLGHVVLYVRDAERSAGFYRDVLGWREILPAEAAAADQPDATGTGTDTEVKAKPETKRRQYAAFSSPNGRTHHELLLIEVGAEAAAYPPAPRIGMYHFGVKIGDTDDELREAVAKLEATGTRVVGSSDHGVTHSLYILDPDGNEIELYIDVADVDWRTDPSLLFSPPKPLNL